MFERRQRLGIERARRRRIDLVFFLRDGRTGCSEEESSEQASGKSD
jgi:hypothetical protein